MSDGQKVGAKSLQASPPTMPPPKTPAGLRGGKKDVASLTGQSLSDDEYWLTVRNITDKASREQQLQLARMVCGLLGANVSFPGARENRLLQEVKAAASVKQKNPTGSRAKKPENAALKSSAEYKEFASAEKALREAKAKLSIAKNDKLDPRVQQEAHRFEEARTKYLDLKKKH
jgi:hypothetical protein